MLCSSIFLPRHLATVVLVLIAFTAFPQTFTPLYPSVADDVVFWLDFDGDGDQDYVTRINRDYVSKPALFENLNGSFVLTDEDFDLLAGQFRVMDYEADNDPDVILYDVLTHTGALFKNTGGTFVRQGFYFVWPTMKWVDYDRDGDEDLVGSSIDGVAFVKNINGILTYQHAFYRSPLYWDAGNFNNDEYCDFVGIFQEGYDEVARVYLGSPEGLLEITVDGTFPPELYNCFVHAFDYDEDGDDDVQIQGKVEPDLEWKNFMFRNNGTIFSADTDPFYDHSYLQNVDDDPAMEYIVGGPNEETEYYNRMPDGTFQQIHSPLLRDFYSFRFISYSNPGSNETFVAVHADIFYTTYGTKMYHVKNGEVTPIYSNPLDIVRSPQMIQFTDFNNDGNKDIFSTGAPNFGPQLLRNTGAGFKLHKRFPMMQIGPGTWTDFDKDGKMDLIGNTGNAISRITGFGVDETVTKEDLITGVGERTEFTIVDFDGDGDNDIMVEDYMQGLYINNGGNFQRLQTFGSSFRIFDKSAWADYDQDGDLDVMLYLRDFDRERIRYFKNTGTGLQEVQLTVFPNYSEGVPYTADFNLDGYPDIFYIVEDNFNARAGLVYNEKGTFTAVNTTVFADLTKDVWYNYSVQIVDFDVDGYPDICVMGDTYNSRKTITALYHNNKGTFEIYNGHGLPELYDSRFHWDDMDNDGDPDMIVSGGHGYSITQVYTNGLVDITGPTVVTLDPADENELTWKVGYKVTVTFNELISKGAGSIKFYRKSDGTELYTADVAGTNALVSKDQLTIAVSENVFNNHEEIYILLDEGVVTDRRGNPSPGTTSETTWNLVINNGKTDQAITFSTIQPKMVTDAPFVLAATSTSGLPVTFQSSDPGVVSIQDVNVAVINGPGEVTITAVQEGNNVFNPAAPETQQLTVSMITAAGANLPGQGFVYPNPASTTIRIYGDFNGGNTTVIIVDSIGRVVIPERQTDPVSPVNISTLNDGLYHIIVRHGADTKRYSFLKK